MSRYIIEMRIPVVVETIDSGVLALVRDDLREKAALHGWEPRFLTAEEWRYNGQFRKPPPFSDGRGVPEMEHRAVWRPPTIKRQAL